MGAEKLYTVPVEQALPSRVATLVGSFDELSGFRTCIVDDDGAVVAGLPPRQADLKCALDAGEAGWHEHAGGEVLVSRIADGSQSLWCLSGTSGPTSESRRRVLGDVHELVTRGLRATLVEQRAEATQRMFQSVLDTIPVRVFWKDTEGRYLGANQLFAADAGLDGPEALLGHDDFDMPWASEADAYRADDAEVMRTGDAKVDYEEPQTTPKGDTIWLQTSKIPLRRGDGSVFGVLGTYADITPRKTIEAQREQLLEELERKNAELERFTYTVSHDLKGPLVTIRGFIGVLREELTGVTNLEATLREDLEHGASRIEAAAAQMARMLDELLSISRAGRVLGARTDVPLRDLVDDALLLCGAATADAGASVVLDEALPRVHVDGARVVQVFQNLIENACKYRSHDRRLELRIRCDAEGMVRVSDNGIGIAPADRTRVFRPFEKVNRDTAGSGIGLSLVARIVAAHGSDVEIEETDGGGTTFQFSLPVTSSTEDET